MKMQASTVASPKKIWDLLPDRDFYWGEISQEEMRHVLQQAARDGCETALRRVIQKHPDLGDYLFSNSRIDWLFHCLAPGHRERCLDLGSGWGSLAFPLTNYFGEVWSVEAVRERLAWQEIRRQQQQIKNLHLVRADMTSLPFPDQHFDLVVLNGVLEWAGLTQTRLSVASAQAQLVSEAYRVLKPHGCLYLGIENRFGLQFFLGTPDHSGLRFTSLLPRRLADFLVRARRYFIRPHGKNTSSDKSLADGWNDYRTYTYSAAGYRRLLQRAGFREIQTYWTYPSYNQPTYSGLLKDPEGLWLCLRQLSGFHPLRRLLKLVLVPGLQRFSKSIVPFFVPGFLIFAHKEQAPSLWTEQIWPERPLLRISGSDRAASSRFVGHWGSTELQLLNVPKAALQQPVELVKPQIAQELYRLDLRPLDPRRWDDSERAIQWLQTLHRTSAQGIWSPERLSERAQAQLQQLHEQDHDPNLLSIANTSVDRWLAQLAKQPPSLPIVHEHGDFWAGNIAFTREKECHIFDWEYAQEKGDPLFDFCFFLLTSTASGKQPEHALQRVLNGQGPYSSIWYKLFDRWAQTTQIASATIQTYLPYALVRVLARSTPRMDLWNPNYLWAYQLLSRWNGYEAILQERRNR
jgi:SAM-dependent methyltransferase